jgi:hypothetical protein
MLEKHRRVLPIWAVFDFELGRSYDTTKHKGIPMLLASISALLSDPKQPLRLVVSIFASFKIIQQTYCTKDRARSFHPPRKLLQPGCDPFTSAEI